MIGNDPLAWLKEESDAGAQQSANADKSGDKKKSKGRKKSAAGKTGGKQVSAAATAKEEENQRDSVDEESSPQTVIQLKPVQDVSCTAQQYEEWKEVLSAKNLMIDGSQVERIDTAFMQLIYALVSEAEINDTVVTWKDPSEALCATARLLGMEKVLHLDCNPGN